MQEKVVSHQEKMNASQEHTIAKMNAWLAEMWGWRKEMTARQEVTEACLEVKEPTSLEVESAVMHEEVPKEKATVETFGALEKEEMAIRL
jgi:hypothetical protein